MQRRAVETRERILAAAEQVILDDGLAALTTARVCRRAGVSRGTYLHHFPTRDEMAAAAIERAITQHYETIERVLDSSDGTIEASLDALWEISSAPNFGIWLELVAAARTNPDARAIVAELSRRLAGVGDEALASRLPATTMLVFATFNGLMLDQILGLNSERVAAARRLLPAAVAAAAVAEAESLGDRETPRAGAAERSS